MNMRNFKLPVTGCDFSGRIKYQNSQEDGRCLGRLLFSRYIKILTDNYSNICYILYIDYLFLFFQTRGSFRKR